MKKLALALIIFAGHPSWAQFEYLATLNYTNLTLSQLKNIPGVTYIEGTGAFDANHNLYFFIGIPANGGAGQLYTINAVTGAIISSPNAPAGNVGGNIYGLEYDNATDTLYTLYGDLNGNAYFAWVDPPTGTIHPIRAIPNFLGYLESTFDIRDHRYIVSGGGVLLVINASTGAVLYDSPNPDVDNIVFDNLTGLLYGIDYSGPNPTFDSVSPTTGTKYQLSSLPSMSYLQIGAFTIDEQNAKFIVVSGNTTSPTCILTTLYVLDIPTGAIVSRMPYPYAQNASAPNDENLIDFCFDNNRGVLYALNWYPPNANLPVTISPSAQPLCAGDAETFTATVWPSFNNPSYQWQLNGADAGSNSPVFTSSALASGDTVRCIFTGQSGCLLNVQDTSNAITVSVNPKPPPASPGSLDITASANPFCPATNVVISAIPSGIPSPSYQWKLNGNDVGADSATWIDTAPATGDTILCVVTSSQLCAPADSAVSPPIVLQSLPGPPPSALSISASTTTICSGDSVVFTPTAVNGGASPAYQWQVNGLGTVSNNDTLMTNGLMNGDIISCILTSSMTCALPVRSTNSILMTVYPTPVISFDPDTIVIRPGEAAALNPIVSGDISSYQWTPETGLNNPTLANPMADPAATLVYQLNLISNNGCQASGKETVLVYYSLKMPSAFTPNGDGRNDVFRIPPYTLQEIKRFSIYNRWGQCLFMTANSSEGWDGTFNRQPQPAGTYVWEIKYLDLSTRMPTKSSGTVLLIR
jgi:gliding motility-associated-like protein